MKAAKKPTLLTVDRQLFRWDFVALFFNEFLIKTVFEAHQPSK